MKNILCCAASAVVLSVASLPAQVLLNDSFTDGERATQSLPDSAAWFGSSTSGMTVADGAFSATGGRAITAYFTPSGSPQALTTAGDSLVLTFDVAYSAATNPTSSAALKVAFANSNGDTRTTADGTNNIFAPYSGYAVSYGYETTIYVRERAAGGSNLALLTSISGYTTVDSGTTLALVDDPFPTVYLATFSITRNADSGLDFSYTLTDKLTPANTWTFTTTDADPSTMAFDTISFGNTSGTDLLLDNVKIEFIAVPEPSSYALLGGVAALAVLAYRRRRLR